MRSRSIKPGFFKNEELAVLGPYAMLLFAGLWTLADREGRLDDRPPRIRCEIFPYAPRTKIVDLLNRLQGAGFIVRYSANGCNYIQICNFHKHQYPHVKEAPSTIPAPDSYQMKPARAHLTPSSPIPHSPIVASVEAPVVIAIPTPIEQQQQQQTPSLACIGEYPKTLSACRAHDPGVDDLFVLRLVQAVIQGAISHHVTNGKLEKINDRAISKAVEESYATGPPTHRAGLLLNRVPSIIVSWCQEDN